MNFLGAFMSVLHLEAGSGVLVHAPLDAPLDGGLDLWLDLPRPLGEPIGIAGQPDIMIEPSAHAHIVHITRGHQDLWADPRHNVARFRDRDEGRFEFLLVGENELALLRRLLAHRWIRGVDEDGPEITFVAEHAFTLDIGLARLDLRLNMFNKLPIRTGPAGTGYVLDTDVGEISIIKAGKARDEILLRKRTQMWTPPRTASPADFRGGADGWLEIEGVEECASLPITVCDDDRDWMFKNPLGGQDQITGRHRCRQVIAHEAGKYVLLSRFAEGVIFDDHGVCNEDGYLECYGHRGAEPNVAPPAGMRFDHGRLFVERAALAEAPFVEGNTIVFFVGHLSNYTHWLIDSLGMLHTLLDYTPPGARLLLPGTLRTLRTASRRVVDHYDTLRVFGFDHLPIVEIEQDYCRLEHAYWVDSEAVFNMPGETMRSLRARVAERRPSPARQDERIYIARRHGRRIANADMLAPFLERQGFTTHAMDDFSVDQQIDLFSQAEWVIGPHGAELGNLLFCRPGTKVLELAPDFNFKPYFSYMCNKLGLTHGVLPCAMTDASSHGDIIVDMRKFTALFRMLKNRL